MLFFVLLSLFALSTALEFDTAGWERNQAERFVRHPSLFRNAKVDQILEAALQKEEKHVDLPEETAHREPKDADFVLDGIMFTGMPELQAMVRREAEQRRRMRRIIAGFKEGGRMETEANTV